MTCIISFYRIKTKYHRKHNIRAMILKVLGETWFLITFNDIIMGISYHWFIGQAGGGVQVNLEAVFFSQ